MSQTSGGLWSKPTATDDSQLDLTPDELGSISHWDTQLYYSFAYQPAEFEAVGPRKEALGSLQEICLAFVKVLQKLLLGHLSCVRLCVTP